MGRNTNHGKSLSVDATRLPKRVPRVLLYQTMGERSEKYERHHEDSASIYAKDRILASDDHEHLPIWVRVSRLSDDDHNTLKAVYPNKSVNYGVPLESNKPDQTSTRFEDDRMVEVTGDTWYRNGSVPKLKSASNLHIYI